jgi:hypothetical protein
VDEIERTGLLIKPEDGFVDVALIDSRDGLFGRCE